MRAAARGTVTLASATGFGACFLALGKPWLLHLFGGVALLSAILLWTVAGQRLALPWRTRHRDLVVGLGAGLAMTALTYPAHDLAASALPWLASEVQRLYAGMRPVSGLAPSLAWIPLVAVVEELLWRGAVVELLGGRAHPRRALLISLALYAAAQAVSGSWLVVVLGLCCGAVWSALRLWTGGLWAPLLCHLMWSTTVLALWPLTA